MLKIGKQIRIGNVPFQVKGVLVTRGAGPGGSSLDGIVFIPVSTASKRLFNRDYLTTITVELLDPLQPQPVIDAITAVLRERHGIVPPGEDASTGRSHPETTRAVTLPVIRERRLPYPSDAMTIRSQASLSARSRIAMAA